MNTECALNTAADADHSPALRSPLGSYEATGPDIDALVNAQVQKKLQELLGSQWPELAQLLNHRGIYSQSMQPEGSSANAVQVEGEAEPEVAPVRDVEPDGIRFFVKDEPSGGIRTKWQDPRIKQIPEAIAVEPNWLTVTKVTGNKLIEHEYEISIEDKSLCDYIHDCIPAYIAHKGSNIWQREKVVLVSEIDTLIFKYHLLESEAYRKPTDQKRKRLQELLNVIRALYDSRHFTELESARSKSFRLELKFIRSLFCPGNFLMAKTPGFDDPQLLRIDYCSVSNGKNDLPFYAMEMLVQLTVHAWMWDWDGKKLVRSMYEFNKVAPHNRDQNPMEWDFLPVELYEDSAGYRGLEALRRKEALRGRRRIFIEHTFAYAAKCSSTILAYSGDAFADAGAFAPPASVLSIKDTFGRRLEQKTTSKLVKLNEDVVLDTQSYCRRVDEGRRFADRDLLSAKFCKCTLCFDQNTQEWFKKLNAISEAEDTNIEAAIAAANDMVFDDNDLLLPPRVFGFALNKKQWCQFPLEKLERIPSLEFKGEGSIVEGLVFPPRVSEEERKDIFKLVTSHRRVMRHSQRLSDLIGGKGESLILLFHGQSGTGKTLYAETLAKACKLGLFKVGTNDIGLEVANAERRLREIFELAELWNTVLLIDEADVLLDTRGKENESLLSKNALVSVLLREVEYFKGILIMTTNRVRAFDPAILSRIHHAVDFEATNQEQELALWELWYKRMVSERACVNQLEIWKWIEDTNRKKKRNYLSGREIRNVFLTAQMLAEDEKRGIKIGRDELERAYVYKDNFLAETEGKIKEAKAMVMSGRRD